MTRKRKATEDVPNSPPLKKSSSTIVRKRRTFTHAEQQQKLVELMTSSDMQCTTHQVENTSNQIIMDQKNACAIQAEQGILKTF